MRLNMLVTACGLTLCLTPAMAEPLDVQALLDQGQFDEAEAQLQARLAEAPDDHDARLALGVTTFLHGIEEFSQTTYRFGVRDVTRDFAMMGPGFSLPIRPNPDPEPVAADDVVAMFERFAEALAEVDAILEPIGDQPAKMTLRLGTVRMDLNADGEAADDENLWRFVEAIRDPPRRDRRARLDRLLREGGRQGERQGEGDGGDERPGVARARGDARLRTASVAVERRPAPVLRVPAPPVELGDRPFRGRRRPRPGVEERGHLDRLFPSRAEPQYAQVDRALCQRERPERVRVMA